MWSCKCEIKYGSSIAGRNAHDEWSCSKNQHFTPTQVSLVQPSLAVQVLIFCSLESITAMIPDDFLRLCSESLKFCPSNLPASTQLLMSAATIATRSSLSEPILARHFAPSIAYPPENKRTYFDLWDYTNKPPYFNQFLVAAQRPVVGNFFLSSCPGKKVRLEGGQPRTEGRAAICRSVQVDLERAARNFGVRLVVCCLDDQGLSVFSWSYIPSCLSEYSL